MTIVSKSRQPSALRSPLEVTRLAYAAIRAIVVTRNHRRQARSLAEMPDYLLKDVGLRRDDIHAALNGDWHEDPTYRLALTAARRRQCMES